MGRQLGQQPGAQPPKGMSVIDLKVELLDQLTVNGLDDLSDSIERLADSGWRLVGLVAPRQGYQA